MNNSSQGQAERIRRPIDGQTAQSVELGMAAQIATSELGDHARAEVADLLDLQLSPLGLAAIDALDPQPGQAILYIGCGAGQALLQLASRVGTSGRVIGVDIAPRVLDVARSRTAGCGRFYDVRSDASPWWQRHGIRPLGVFAARWARA